MIVVSDASPLNYLVLIGAEHLLHALFETVYVPLAVVGELQNPKTPAKVLDFITNRPAWLIHRSPLRVDLSPALHRGELEAIALAEELRATTLLIDEHAGRRVAKARGLHVTGTLGVLELGAERGLISLAEAVRELRSTDYRIAERIIAGALKRAEERQKRS